MTAPCEQLELLVLTFQLCWTLCDFVRPDVCLLTKVLQSILKNMENTGLQSCCDILTICCEIVALVCTLNFPPARGVER